MDFAKDPELRAALIGTIPYQSEFGKAKVAAFMDVTIQIILGDIAEQLGKAHQFREYWEKALEPQMKRLG